MKKYFLASAALVSLLAAAACTSAAKSNNSAPPAAGQTTTSTMPSTSNPPTGASSPGTITIQNFAFGSPLTVAPGAKVTVTNKDSVEHTVTSDDGKSFNVSVAAGATVTFTAPTAAGTFTYHCTVHPMMHGTLTVSSAGGSSGGGSTTSGSSSGGSNY